MPRVVMFRDIGRRMKDRTLQDVEGLLQQVACLLLCVTQSLQGVQRALRFEWSLKDFGDVCVTLFPTIQGSPPDVRSGQTIPPCQLELCF